MKFSDIFYAIFIFLVFIGIYLVNIAAIGTSKIKKNWPNYRCNPMIIPFASYFGHDPVKNFTYCLQGTQRNYSGHLMQPLIYSNQVAHANAKHLTNSVQSSRTFMSQFRSFFAGIADDIFGVFLNALIQIDYLFIKIRDMAAKIIGIVTTMLFLIDGAVKTGESVNAGPIGGTLRFLCFHPETQVQLMNTKVVKMSDIEIGNTLKNGSTVIGTLRLSNYNKEPFYEIDGGENNSNILVTGSHLIQDSKTKRFIPVANSPLAKKTSIIENTFSCLITDSHIIPIGKHIFWDYDD